MFSQPLPSLAALGLALSLTAGPALATGVPGLAGATLLPGWTTPGGTRMTAIDLRLEPGWKTYWRSPGDAGIPPSFDWSGSTNAGPAQYHWPAPEVIDSGGIRSLGFHDRLLLPVEITPAAPGQPVKLALAMDFGLCREVCVPAHITLSAPAVGDTPDPVIEAALAAVPVPVTAATICQAAPIEDGMRLSATVPAAALPAGAEPRVAIELAAPAAKAGADAKGGKPAADPEGSAVWVSEPDLTRTPDGLTAAADLVPPEGKPFDIDPRAVRLTVIGEAGAVELQGCSTLTPAAASPAAAPAPAAG